MSNHLSATFRAAVIAVCIALAGGCQQASPPTVPPTAAEADMPAFVGRVWVSTTPGAARGSILVFLPDKTVLQDSCFEGFRIMQWGIISPTRIRWIEDRFPIEAEHSQPSPHELVLSPVGADRPHTYVAASAPYVCPES